MIKMKNLWSLLTIIMAAMVSIGLSSCGSDDDDNDGNGGSGSVDMSGFIGKVYSKTEESVDHSKTYEVGFLSPYFATVHKYGKDLDPDYDKGTIWNYWDQGEVSCMYTTSGNKISVQYDNSILGEPEYIVMTISGNKPEGWEYEGKTKGKTSFDTFDAKPGTSNMFGYYSSDVLREIISTAANEKVSIGYLNRSYWEDLENYWSTAYRIVDGNTIHRVYESVSLKEPKDAYVYQKETYNVESLGRSATYTLYYYFDTSYYEEAYKYVMNGSSIVKSDGSTVQYQDGKLIESNGYSFTKK